LLLNKNLNKMKKSIIKNVIISVIAGFAVVSCNLFGLPLQEEYPYEYTSKDPNINMTAYEFVESRQTIDMARMYEAILITGLESEYREPNRTFIILNDNAFSSYMSDKNLTDLTISDTEVLKNYLLSNIARGEFTSLNLNTVPKEMDILVSNDSTKLFLNRRGVSVSSQNKYEVDVNNFPGSSRSFRVRTSNILPTNGVIHVVNNYPEYRIAPLP